MHCPNSFCQVFVDSAVFGVMEKWDCHRKDYNSHNPEQHLHRHHNHRSRNQSFSSALLSAICKSIEDEGGMMAYTKRGSPVETRNVEAENNILRRNSRIESQWNDDPLLNDVKSVRGRSPKISLLNAEKREAEATYSKYREFHQSLLSNKSPAASCSSGYTNNTSTNSSISSSYLSSDTESLYSHTSSIPTAKTKTNSHQEASSSDRGCKWTVGGEYYRHLHGKSSVRDEDFPSTVKPFSPADDHAKIKSKSKTGKDLKNPNQPISPGRKLINFLSSFFMTGGTKKAKPSSSPSVSDSNSCYSSEKEAASIYSSSSSVQSRPCLSKTSKGYSNNRSGMTQKSVTFCPTNVIVDEDFRPCGEKYLHRTGNPAPNPHTHPSKGAYKLPLLEKDSHAVAARTKDIIAKYQKANGIMEAVIRSLDKQDEEEVASCSSSDLFELENLADIDMNVYQKELPVYETTHWETNKAIAKGLIV